jgi:hypothetical protein
MFRGPVREGIAHRGLNPVCGVLCLVRGPPLGAAVGGATVTDERLRATPQSAGGPNSYNRLAPKHGACGRCPPNSRDGGDGNGSVGARFSRSPV